MSQSLPVVMDCLVTSEKFQWVSATVRKSPKQKEKMAFVFFQFKLVLPGGTQPRVQR